MTTFSLLFLGMATFGSATPVSKIVTEHFPPLVASGLRMATGAALLLPFVVAAGRPREPLRRGDVLRVLVLAGIGTVGFTVFLLYGMREVSGVVGAIVMSTAPAVTAAASVVFLRDRLGADKALAIALAVGGVLLINAAGARGAGDGRLVLGTLLVFGAVCSEATYTLVGKVVTERFGPLLTTAAAAGLGALMFVPLVVVQWGALEAAAVPADAWLALAWWGGGVIGFGSVVWYAGVGRAAGSTAAGFMGVMPLSALVLSYVLLGEPVLVAHLVGFAVVFLGVVLIARSHMREHGEHGGGHAH